MRARLTEREPTLKYPGLQVLTGFEAGDAAVVTGDGEADTSVVSPYRGSQRSWRIDLLANTVATITIELPVAVDLTGKCLALGSLGEGAASNFNLFQLELAETSAFSAYFYRGLNFPGGERGVWHYAPYTNNLLTTQKIGSPNIASIKYVRLKVRATTARSVWLDEILVYDDALAGTAGVASFRFDDGFLSQYEKLPTIFESRGLRFGVYVAENWVNQSEAASGIVYMNEAQLKALYDSGHEVGVHGITGHVTTHAGDYDAILTDVMLNANALAKRGIVGSGSGIYVYPGYQVAPPASWQVVGRRFRLGSVSAIGEQSTDLTPPPVATLTRSTALRETIATEQYIANQVVALTRGEWRTYVCHQIDADLMGNGISSATLGDLLDALIAADVTILPIGEVAQRFMAFDP